MPSLSNIIGQASRGADLYFVFRFLRLLTMKYTSTAAYKLGIIDRKGKALKRSADLESTKEKAAYTMMHRMTFKIRGLIEKIPVLGKSILTNYAAALFLLKEQDNPRLWTDDGYMKSKLLEFLETDWEAEAKFLKEEVDNMEKKSFTSFLSETKKLNESQELQAMMALDDAGIEAVIDKKGQIVVNKRDLKKAEKALKKSFRKGGAPELVGEEVELDEGTALQVRMALDDVGLKGKWKNNKVYVKKRDVEKAKKALKGNVIYKGKTPEVIGEEMDPRDHVEEKDGKFVVVAPSGKIVYTSDDKKEAEEWAIKNHDDLMKEEVELVEEVSEKDFDALKKGDTITIEFKSSMSAGKSTFRVTAKNIVGKAKVHKATLQNVKNPRSVKFFLYKRGNKVSLAQGDMAASVVKYTIEGVELDEATVLDVKDVDKWTTEIKKGIDAGWVSVGSSTLGGDENVAILIKLTIEPEKDWPNKILQNARFGMIRIATDGTMEMFASDRRVKNMRKTKVRSTKDVVNKINTWIKSVSEEVVIERKMTDSEKEEREEIVKKLKPKLQSFKDRYGDDAKKVMYATATKQAMEEVELEEKKSATGYELYHKTFSAAMQHAYDHAKSKGHVVDPKEIDDKVATGPKKPSSGKTNRYSLKAGRKKVEIQVANLDNKRYELNMYIEGVELDEEVFYWYIVQGNTQKGKVSHVGTERQLKLKIRKPIFPSGHLLLKSRKRLKVGDKWKGSYQPEEVEVEEALSRKDQLRLALAKSKFKKSGGKVEVQPPSPATGSKKYRGMYMAAPKTKEDEKMAQDVLDYRKKMYKKKMKREGVELEEAFSMGKGDKRVVDAFYDQKEIKAHGASILTTDGKTLTKRGMGGQDIAKWVNGKIKIVAVSDVKSTELILKYMKKSIPSGVFEDVKVDETTNSVGGGNVAGLGVGAQGEPGARPRKKKKKIDESVKMSRFAGKDVFIVDSDTYHACRLGKKQYARYEKYVGKNRIGLAIREYGLKYPKRPIILQNGDSGPMLYLKYGRS